MITSTDSAARTFNCRITNLFVLILAFFGSTTSVLTQNPYLSVPDRGIINGKSYDVSQIERIGHQDGSVNLTIPLASLPPLSGGKLGFTINAYYTSKPWKTYAYHEYLAYPVIGLLGIDQYTPWRVGGGYRVEIERISEKEFAEAMDVCDQFVDSMGQTDYQTCAYHRQYDYRVYVHTPDGGKHELRTLDHGTYPDGQMPYRLGSYKDIPSNINAPIRYYTVDGSYMWVQVNPRTYWWDTSDWTILLKDGTKIVNTPDGVQRITDTNGNTIRIYQDSQWTYYQDEATGREIKVSHANIDPTTPQQLGYRTVGGAWEYIEIKWEWLTITGIYTPDNSPCTLPTLANESLPVIREIKFPSAEAGHEGRKFSFEYNADTSIDSGGATYALSFPDHCQTTMFPQEQVSAGWGELSRVTFPSGSVTEYEYNGNTLGSTMASDVRKNVITSKKLIHDGVEDIWSYTHAQDQWTQVTNPDGSTDKYYFINGQGTYDWNKHHQLTYKEEHSGKLTKERRWKRLKFDGTNPSTGFDWPDARFNNVVEAEYTTLLENGSPIKTSAKTYLYDYNGNVTKTIEYDWFDPALLQRDTYGPTGVPVSAKILRVTETEYHNQASASNSNNIYAKQSLNGSFRILNAPKETSTYGFSSSGTQYLAKRTRFSYDGTSYGVAPTLGNLTKSSAYDDTSGLWLDTISTYDVRGNVTSQTDANGNVTQFTYGSINGYNNLYPTQTIRAYGTSVARTSSTVYDFYTGLVISTVDEDNDVSVVTEYDLFGRPIKVRNGVGTPLESWTTTEYRDAERFRVVRTDVAAVGDGKKVSIEHFDQLDRRRLLRVLENPATEDPYNETHGVKVETHYLTANPNNYKLTSNPFRAATSAQAAGEPTMGWTRTKSWNHGRRDEVEHFSGSAMPAPWGSNTNSTGVSRTDIYAERKLVTDQSGKQRISRVDALGQLTDVWEITAQDSATEAVTFPGYSGISYGYKTSYKYDAVGNLTTVNQGSQTRTFTYNSLSRLLAAKNPESGTTTYTYDNNGNLKTKRDARNIKTVNDYDALDRLTNRCYRSIGTGSLGMTTCANNTETPELNTPDVTFTYDNLTNAKGRLTKVSSAISTTEYTSFDALGRVTGHRQTTDGVAYNTSYIYNLSGEIVEETYPSGRKARNTLDAEGDLMLVETQAPGGSWQIRANNFAYTAAGAVSGLQLGNSRWESTQFNSKLQPVQIALGSSQNATDLLKLNYDYGNTANNGNVIGQTITVPTVGITPGFTAVQTYTYDALNRLKSATETVDGVQSWKQSFIYDRYGNRNFDTAQTTTLGSCPAVVCNPGIDVDHNQLVGYSYDAAGNTTVDAESRQFTYDARNKQTLVKDPSNAIIGQYYYDGEGKRVMKTSNLENSVFVYDVVGRLIEEYSQTGQVSYYYADRRLLATETNAGFNYTTIDYLGTPRINTDQNGNVTARHDYHPFGEEIFAVGGRTMGIGYTADSVRKRFTGYERDDETNLDFAQARYHASTLGRFSSPDPLLSSALLLHPQTLNRYIYVINNPLRFIDPLGLLMDCPKGQKCEYDELGEYYIDKDGGHVYTSLTIEVEGYVKGTTRKIDFDFGNGWVGSLDQFNGGEGFEIHVFDPSGTEQGIVNGRNGWIRKHGHEAAPPAGIPQNTLNKINSANLQQLRRRGLVPPNAPFRRGAYLNTGRRIYGILGFLNGLTTDYEILQRANENGRTYQEQLEHELKESGPYVDTPLGLIPNPYYRGDIIDME